MQYQIVADAKDARIIVLVTSNSRRELEDRLSAEAWVAKQMGYGNPRIIAREE